MTGDGVQIDPKSQAILNRLSSLTGKEARAARDRLRRFMGQLAKITAGHVIKTQFGGSRSSKPAPAYTPGAKERKRRRTGSLARSIEGRANTDAGIPSIEIGIFRGPALKYAGIQEFGTKSYNPNSPYPDIVPREKKALAAPIGPSALTPAGVPRYDSPRNFPEPLKPVYRGIRGFKWPARSNRHAPKSKVIGILVLQKEYEEAVARSITGLFDYEEPDFSAVEVVYMLLRSAAIPPGFFLSDGVQDFLPSIITRINDFLTSELFPEPEAVAA